MSCAAGALPWVAPCCAQCAGARAAGAADPSPSTAPPQTTTSGLSTGAGAALVLGLIFLGVVYGEKMLGKLGG